MKSPSFLSAVTVSEAGHGIYPRHLDDLKAAVPVHPVTEITAEIIVRIGGKQEASGISLPLGDLLIGACALEPGYAVATTNFRDFNRIPVLQLLPL